MSKYFLISFDSEGFECIQDITDYHPENFKLKQAEHFLSTGDKLKNPLSQQITSMEMRARFNPQRNPGIYVIKADTSFTETDIKQWAESSPQEAADWVREHNWHTILSNAPKKAVIT